MTKKKLNKKLIVTTNFYGVTDGKFIVKTKAMAEEAENDPAIEPLLDPSPADVKNIIKDLGELFTQRNLLKAQQKGLTTKIKETKDNIKDIFNSKWAPKVQYAVGTDVSKLKKLGFGARGQFDGHTEDVVGKASESQPLILKIDISRSLMHRLEIVNNKTGSRKLPPDAYHTEIYIQIGGDEEPEHYKKMHYFGIARKGKIEVQFKPEDLDKMVYYIAVYVDKATLKPISQSWVKKAKVVMNY